MGHKRLGSNLAYVSLGLAIFLACATHGTGAWWSSNVELTLTLNQGSKIMLSFSQRAFERLVSCLCNDHQSSCSFHTGYILHDLPTTISGDLDDLSTWRIFIYYDAYWKVQYALNKKNSKNSDLRCWKKEYLQILKENPTCSSKPQIVYLGGNRWLEIDDKVRILTYDYDDNDENCNDGNQGCTGDCITTPTPTIASSTENVVNNTGNNTDIFIGNITDITMGNETETTGTASPQTESSSDQTPVIVGVVIAVLIVLILLAILAVILWRRKKSKQAEANPAFAAFNPGAYADAEFIQSGNAHNEATEGGDSQSVPRQPPPYSEVERNPQHGFTNDGYGVSGDVQI